MTSPDRDHSEKHEHDDLDNELYEENEGELDDQEFDVDALFDAPGDAGLERLNGADLYYEVAGPDDAPAVVFLHGGPGYNSYSFRALIGQDLEQYRMVYTDMRGSGRSGPLSETEQGDAALDIDTLVADLEALRDHLGLEKFVPLGHGFGALVALEYGRRFPTRTARIVVVNPWLHFPDLALTLLAEASAMRGAALEDPADRIKANTPEGEYPAVGEARLEAAFALVNARDLLNALQFTSAPTRMRLEYADVEGQLLGGGEVQQALVNQGLWSFEYPPFLMEQKRPVYVIAGTQDRTSYPEQVGWLEDLIQADVTLLDTGHYPWLDDEDGFLEALERAIKG